MYFFDIGVFAIESPSDFCSLYPIILVSSGQYSVIWSLV